MLKKRRQIRYVLLLLASCLSTPLFAGPIDNKDTFEGLYLGLSMNSIDLGINSKIQNHDTVLFSSGGLQPSLFYRSRFTPSFGSHVGYYFEYGMDRFTLRQGLIWDPVTTQDIDPQQNIKGWYGYAAPMLAYRSDGLTMAIGPALNIIRASGGFAVNYSGAPALSYENFYISKLSASFRLLIEGETKNFIWGMRMLSLDHQDSQFDYDIGFIVFYLGMRL